MGMAIQFDTLRYVETLESAGIPRSQAKAYAEVLATALGQDASWAPTIKDGIVDIKSGLADIRIELADIRIELADIRTGLADIRIELADIRTGLADIRTGLADIRIELADIKSDLKLMKWMLVSVAAGVLSLVMKAYA